MDDIEKRQAIKTVLDETRGSREFIFEGIRQQLGRPFLSVEFFEDTGINIPTELVAGFLKKTLEDGEAKTAEYKKLTSKWADEAVKFLKEEGDRREAGQELKNE